MIVLNGIQFLEMFYHKSVYTNEILPLIHLIENAMTAFSQIYTFEQKCLPFQKSIHLNGRVCLVKNHYIQRVLSAWHKTIRLNRSVCFITNQYTWLEVLSCIVLYCQIHTLEWKCCLSCQTHTLEWKYCLCYRQQEMRSNHWMTTTLWGGFGLTFSQLSKCLPHMPVNGCGLSQNTYLTRWVG